jgi:hypothetical protein
MTPHGSATSDGSDEQDPTAAVDTGRRGQRLICEGWFASHADSGAPGAHVHLRTTDGQDPVLRTDQVPNLVEALSVVADRIDRLWAAEGAEYAETVVLRSPDPQDPEVVRQRHLARLRFTQGVAENLPEVMRLLTEASTIDDALVTIAGLLRVDEGEVMARLARFDLLTLTRQATEARLRAIAELGE